MTVSGRFIGQGRLVHDRSPRLGVVLVNLGTPDAPTPKALRRYLAEFLSDPRVVEIPPLLWRIILHGIILRVRPKKSARAYAAVWGEHGSPLMASSKALTDAVRARLANRIPGRISVALAMRYGQPSIADVLRRLQADGAERLLVLPLYPQYSGATTGSVADAVFKELQGWRWTPELRMLGTYHDDPSYIRAIADSISAFWAEHGRSERLLISFHGMPRATLEAGDPYFCQCHKTARLIAEHLKVSDDDWEMAFQSRFGAAEWLQPYVAERLERLPGEGVKHLSVVCPGFACDCLETLEEIAIQGKQSFLQAGGERLDYIPALNADDRHVTLQVERILRHGAGWPELDVEASAALVSDREQTSERAATERTEA